MKRIKETIQLIRETFGVITCPGLDPLEADELDRGICPICGEKLILRRDWLRRFRCSHCGWKLPPEVFVVCPVCDKILRGGTSNLAVFCLCRKCRKNLTP